MSHFLHLVSANKIGKYCETNPDRAITTNKHSVSRQFPNTEDKFVPRHAYSSASFVPGRQNAPCFVHSGWYWDSTPIQIYCLSSPFTSNTNALYCLGPLGCIAAICQSSGLLMKERLQQQIL